MEVSRCTVCGIKDLDPVLWAVGGQPLEESGKAAERINQRRQNKKKKLRRERLGDYHQPPTNVYSENCTIFRGK